MSLTGPLGPDRGDALGEGTLQSFGRPLTVVETRQGGPGDPSPDGPFDGAKIRFLSRGDERQRIAQGFGPRGPAHAMDVVLGQCRNVEVHRVTRASMSIPRAAMSVATSTWKCPRLKPARACVR